MTVPATRHPCLPPGTRVGPFEVTSLLGAGGMGEVYRALDTRLGRAVAIKVLPAVLAADRERLRRFEQEARATAALDHPNILAIHDLGTHEGQPYIVEELLDGESLRERLQDGAIPIKAALEVAAQIARGLAAAHHKGIVHRDLKPENVMVTSDGLVKILDFGLAKLVQQDAGDPVGDTFMDESTVTQAGLVLGTPGYMAPEQVRGLPADQRTDIFAFGCVLYEMITGRRAFTGETRADVLSAVLTRDPPPLGAQNHGVPPALAGLVSRCLEKRPEGRFASIHDLAIALELVGRDVLRVRPRVRHSIRRSWAWALALAAVTASGVASLWLLRGDLTTSLPSFRPRRVTNRGGIEREPAVSPAGTEVAYAEADGKDAQIWIVDARGGSPLRLTDGPGWRESPAWFPDGSTIAYVANEGGQRSIYRVSRFGGPSMVLVRDASDPAISPDGSTIAFARGSASGSKRIWTAPLAEPGAARAITTDGDGLWDHQRPAWSPDGGLVCYHDHRHLWLVPRDGGPARRLTEDEHADTQPTWSPNGRYVYFTSYRDGAPTIWRVARSGGPPHRVTLGAGPEGWPTVSADGRRLVYSTHFETGTVSLIDLGTGQRAPVREGQWVMEPALAPDGGSLLFVSDRAGTYDIWKLQVRAGRPDGAPERLTALQGTCAHPVFSPDGQWVAFFRVVDGQRDVWIMPAGGGAPQNFTSHPAVDTTPEWSPDGSHLAFVSDRGGSQQLWVAPVVAGRRTGEPRQVAQDAGGVSSPAWSPDGSSIAYLDGERLFVAPVWKREAARAVPAVTDGLFVQWVRRTGAFLVCARWGASTASVREVSLDGTVTRPLPFATGSSQEVELFDFDISTSGTLLALQEWSAQGDVWMLEVEKGVF